MKKKKLAWIALSALCAIVVLAQVLAIPSPYDTLYVWYTSRGCTDHTAEFLAGTLSFLGLFVPLVGGIVGAFGAYDMIP